VRKIVDEELKLAQAYIGEAAKQALLSFCKRSRCGSVVVSRNGVISGWGYNSPPGKFKPENEATPRCLCNKESYHKKVTDKTCCVHAEERAIINAISNISALQSVEKPIIWTTYYFGLPSSFQDELDKIYFTRINDNNEPIPSGKPYCTICSKLALDVGIKEFVLVHEDGVYAYSAEEYNELSYSYKEEQ